MHPNCREGQRNGITFLSRESESDLCRSTEKPEIAEDFCCGAQEEAELILHIKVDPSLPKCSMIIDLCIPTIDEEG